MPCAGNRCFFNALNLTVACPIGRGLFCLFDAKMLIGEAGCKVTAVFVDGKRPLKKAMYTGFACRLNTYFHIVPLFMGFVNGF